MNIPPKPTFRQIYKQFMETKNVGEALGLLASLRRTSQRNLTDKELTTIRLKREVRLGEREMNEIKRSQSKKNESSE